jgi:hypothetical protein
LLVTRCDFDLIQTIHDGYLLRATLIAIAF